MKTPIVYTVTDTGPVDGVYVLEREIRFKVGFQDEFIARKVLSREEPLHAYDKKALLASWNGAFIADAFIQFYEALAEREEKASR